MLFNSLEFILFLPVLFILYWFVFNKNLRLQNILLLIASYVFYGWWDYRFLSLIFLSTLVDFFVGLKIERSRRKQRRKAWLWVSVIFNLGLLGYFKYYNFFVQSWVDAFGVMGYPMDIWTMNIVLPVGISFYTFQTMSYSMDIYKDTLKPTTNFIDFATFVSFFPQLVAGPIERASNLLPQIQMKRAFDSKRGFEGFELILWGLFKKVVIADSLAGPVNEIFSNYQLYDGGTLMLGTIFFAIQIYGDFSGYSDIAIGVAKLFGIDLKQNFNFPYFSKSISEFWRKWHISLSTWFRDYLYLPLGGSRVPLKRAIINVFIVFLVSGFWHGANWTFLVWGLLHGLYFIPSFILRKKKNEIPIWKPRVMRLLTDLFNIVITFSMVCLAWIFFRADSLQDAFTYISRISWDYSFNFIKDIKYVVLFLFFELLVFFVAKTNSKEFSFAPIRYMVYTYFLLTIISHTTKEGSSFIYFQF